MALIVAGLLLAGILAPGLNLIPGLAGREGRRGPNVLLLTVDCLRADRLGCYGSGRATSPGLDLLAREGALFENCVGQSAWTSPGLVTVLSGVYPEVHGVRGRASVPFEGLPALPAIFRELGYEVPNLSYLTSLQNYWRLGYDQPKRDLMREAEDRHVVDFLEQEHRRPFFAWYHYRFIHLPLTPPEPWKSELVTHDWPDDPSSRDRLREVQENVLLKRDSVDFTEGEQQLIRQLYDAEVRRMDAFISSILKGLNDSGLAENTIVAVTADHGEELFERGFIGHASTNFSGTLHREILHLPLILKAPGKIPAGSRLPGLCGQIDVAPTLLDLCGFNPQEFGFQGVSLMPLIEGEEEDAHPALFSSTTLAGYQTPSEEEGRGLEAVTTRDWKLIRQVPSGWSRLYDLRSDPGELAPVTDPERQKMLENLLHLKQQECDNRARALNRALPATIPAVPVSREPPVLLAPSEGKLTFEQTGGIIEIVLRSDSPGPFIAEYDVGTGVYATSGVVILSGAESRFGPFSRELWKTLELWNPWRFRVAVESTTPRWSEWKTFEIHP